MPTERPDIVLITADQWRGDCLGSADAGDRTGTRHPVMTPHLDQLAAEGARFTQMEVEFEYRPAT
jgi:arylsulfatase A-like enzyme